MSKFQQSAKTTFADDEFPQLDLEEQSFQAEVERCYLEKLRVERAKVEELVKDREQLNQLLQQKEFLLKTQQRKLHFLGEQASYKPKFDDLYERLKQTEAEKDALFRECDNLRSELAECIQQKNALAKEMKECVRDTDFKLSEKYYEMQQAINQKDRVLEDLKQRNMQLHKKLQEETFKKDTTAKLQADDSNGKIRELTDEVQRMEKALHKRQEEIYQQNDQLDSLQFRNDSLQQQLLNKEEQMEAQTNSYQKLLQKMKFHLRQLRCELADKQRLIIQQKEQLDRANDTLRKAEVKLLNTNEELKLQERNHNDLLNRANFDWGQDKQSFMETTRGLKANIDELLRVKSQLVLENTKLHTVAKHRQSTDKVKSGIAVRQHRQIDRVDRMLLRN